MSEETPAGAEGSHPDPPGDPPHNPQPPYQPPPGYPPAYPPAPYPPGYAPPVYPPPPAPPPHPPYSVQPPAQPNPYGPAQSWGQSPYGYAQVPGYPPPVGPYGYGYQAPAPVDLLGRPLASWGQRVGAFLIDSLVIGLPTAVIVGIVASHTITTTYDPFSGASTTNVSPWFGWAWVIAMGVQILYFAVLDGLSQSVGKRALGIAVRSARTGQPIGFWRALARWLIYSVLWWAFLLPGLLNALSPLWDTRRQAWHDHSVDSLVVRVN